MKIPQAVRVLPGALDQTPVIHSNSPELVLQSGVLVSTFPPGGKAFPEAHLNHAVSGKFELFLHHSTDCSKAAESRSLYLGILAGNLTDKSVRLEETAGASFATKPDAPFVVLDAVLPNDDKGIFAGPGDRVSLEMLTATETEMRSIELAPGEIRMIRCLALPKGSMFHPLNGRTGSFKFHADGQVHIAVVAAFAKRAGMFSEQAPPGDEFLELLKTAPLVEPRDKTPSVPGAGGELVYGRVAGVASGGSWNANITDHADISHLSVSAGQTISYPLCSLVGGTLGTGQVQSAEMLARYGDTAYQSHGNYGVAYRLVLPVRNTDAVQLSVGFSLQSPLKSSNSHESLAFSDSPKKQVVFRGSVKLAWPDEFNELQTRVLHLVQTQGMQCAPLLELIFQPNERRQVIFDMVYAADCTPPHVLTITARK